MILYKLFKRIDFFSEKISNLSDRKKKNIILILSTLCFIFMYHLNSMFYLWSDDFSYTFIYKTDQRIHSISDVIHSQYLHYMQWGGRTVAHFIAQVLLMLDLKWADILNALVYVLFVGLIYKHAKGKQKKHSISVFLLINLFIWFFQPEFAETMLWTTGSANYLWTTLIILTFLLPYRLYDNQNYSKGKSFLYSLFMLLGGIIAGWTNENVVVAMLLMIVLWLILYRKQNWKIPIWGLLGLLGLLVGFGFLILAPGNFERLNSSGGVNMSLFFVYFKFNMYTERLINTIGFILLLSMIFLILVLKFTPNSKGKYYLSTLLIYILGIFIPVYAMIPSPTFPGRAWFGLVTFAIVSFTFIFYKLNSELTFIRYIKVSVVTFFLFAFVFSFYKSYKEIKQVRNIWVEREGVIKQFLSNEKDSVAVRGIEHPSKYVLRDGSWTYSVMSKYYGIQIVDADFVE